MNPETVLIELYLTIEAAYQGLTYGQPLRQDRRCDWRSVIARMFL